MLGSGTGQPIMAPETFDNLDTGKQIGSGPYFLDQPSSRSTTSTRSTRKFREAAKGLPYIAEREVKFIPDLAAQEAAFRSGQLDRWRSATPTPGTTSSEGHGAARSAPIRSRGLGNFFWHMNMEKNLPWQTDVRVREAFWRLTNRQQILELGLRGEGMLPDGLLPAGLKPYQLDAERHRVRTTRGRRQGEAATQRGELRPRHATSTSWAAAPAALRTRAAQVWKQQLARAGIKTTISNITGTAQLFQRWTDNNWELMVQGSPARTRPARRCATSTRRAGRTPTAASASTTPRSTP